MVIFKKLSSKKKSAKAKLKNASFPTDPVKRLQQYFEIYKHGYNTPGGHDISNMNDYIKYIELVANLKTDEAVSILKEIQSCPCYTRIETAVNSALKKIELQGITEKAEISVIDNYGRFRTGIVWD